ncbi:MAG: hypothetical protein IJT03_05965 [Clostridia bacterium]|nr:hypothetical protein [Clostridia bacterium]
MNKMKVLAIISALAIAVCSFSSCGNASTPGAKNDDEVKETPETIELVSDNTIVEDVTSITGATDPSGKVTDSVGINDKQGHKIYSTGQIDVGGDTIYTTGKKATTGDILYTKNKTDSFGNIIYYTGKYDKNGKLTLTATTEAPDYTSNETPKAAIVQGSTTTTKTVGEKANSKIRINDAECKFTKYFGGSGVDTFAASDSCKDGGFVVAGTSSSKDGDCADADKDWGTVHGVVAKYSADGKLEWKYAAGGDSYLFFYDVTVLKDGTVIAVGDNYSSDSDAPSHSAMFSGYIVRLDEDGKLMWSYSFPGDGKSNGEYISTVKATPDGGFVAGGKADSTAGFFSGTKEKGSKAFVFKFDKNCNLKWRRILTGSKSNDIAAIDVNSSGEIYACCVTTSTDGDFSAIRLSSAATKNTVLLKLSKNGDLKWAKYLEGSGNSEFKTVFATSDGGCIVGGSYTIIGVANGIYSMNYGQSDGYVIRYNSDGDVCWSRTVGGTKADYINAVAEVEGGYVIAGTTSSNDMDFQGQKIGGGSDGFIMYLNNQGKTTATVIQDGTADDGSTSVCVLKDGSVGVAGWTKSKDNAFAGSGASAQSKAFVSRYTALTEKSK